MPQPTAELTPLDSQEDLDFWELLEKYRNKPVIVKDSQGLATAGKFQGRIVIEVFHKPGSRNDTNIAMTWVMPDSLNMGKIFKNVAEDLISYARGESQ